MGTFKTCARAIWKWFYDSEKSYKSGFCQAAVVAFTKLLAPLCLVRKAVSPNAVLSVSPGNVMHHGRTDFGKKGWQGIEKEHQSEPWKCYFLPSTLPNLVKNMAQWIRAVSNSGSPQTYNHYLLWSTTRNYTHISRVLHIRFKDHAAIGCLKMKSRNMPWA